MLVVAGLGRCGTTLIMKSIKKKYSFVSNLNELGSRRYEQQMWKTHGLPATNWPSGTKIIWCFGDPRDIVVSCITNGFGFLHSHCLNLGGDLENLGNILEKDVLGLDKHFTAWYNNIPGIRLATVKYERLYANLDEIKRFIGLPLSFPTFMPRNTNWRQFWAADKIDRTYGALAQRIAKAEDFKVWS